MRGTLDLGITANRRNQSFISRMNYTFPLKVLRPFYLDGIGTAYIYLLDTAGGMLAGDSLDYRIRVEDGARLYLTNASASKSYVMNGGGAQVHQFFFRRTAGQHGVFSGGGHAVQGYDPGDGYPHRGRARFGVRFLRHVRVRAEA